MGKGDQRSRRGKIWRGTFGRRRPKKRTPVKAVATEPEAEKKSPRKETDAGA